MGKRGNRQKAGGRQPTSTSWKPGQSGNPAGRPPLSEEQRSARLQAQAVLDAHTVEAAWTAVEMLGHADPKARAAALNSILDRAGLKGVERLQITGADGGPVQVDLMKLTDSEARIFNALLKKTARAK